jgi:hypothetical protein
VLLGFDLRTRKPLFLDGWGLRASGDLNGLVMRVDGMRSAGKSTFMKALTLRIMGLQAGLNADGYPNSLRVRITDQKAEGGKPEYDALTRLLQSEVIRPVEDGLKINPFDPSMGDLISMLETSVNLAETVIGRALKGFEPLAHQVAVAKMYRDFRDVSSLEVLESIFMRLTLEDVEAYFRDNSHVLVAELTNSLQEKPQLMDQLRLLIDRPNNLPREQFQEDAARQAAAISRLTKGEYGGFFGRGMSIRSLLAQQVATIDRTGMSPRVRTIFEALMWRWQTWALQHNDTSLIPHVNIGDEAQESYGSLMFLRFYDDYVRKARAFHTWDIQATQFSGSLDMTGAEGSEERQLAKNIGLGVSMRIIGKQPNDAETLHGLTALGLSEEDASFCTGLPMGCFGLKLPDRPVVFFQMVLTSHELAVVRSDAANSAMMRRVGVYDLEDIRRSVLEAAESTTEGV